MVEKYLEFLEFLKTIGFPLILSLTLKTENIESVYDIETGLIQSKQTVAENFETDLILKNPWIIDIYPCKTMLITTRPNGDPTQSLPLLDKISQMMSQKDSYDLFYHMFLRQSFVQEKVHKIGGYQKASKMVKKFDFEKCGITKCHFQCLQNCVNLETINLSNNRIRCLDHRFFQGLENLKEIHANNNSIVKLPNGIFKGLINLEILDLRSNLLKELNETVFNDLKNLKIVDLSSNRLKHLDNRLFNKNMKLKWVYLTDNPIENLDDMKNTEKLKL